jgi:phytoene dehydrogenase-like protein
MGATTNCDVIIIGAGVSGLHAARLLHAAGRTFQLLEAQRDIGGRLRTSVCNGFLLDHGFQVLQTAYPGVSRAVNLKALHLGYFVPGACVWNGKRLLRIADPLRQPGQLLESLRSPLGTASDKFKVALLKMGLLTCPPTRLYRRHETSTATYLRQKGFSTAFIEQFLRPFFNGIFLEEELASSSRMFEFVFSMLSKGHAALPAHGIRAIPLQLAEPLPPDSIRTECRVQQIHPREVCLANGQSLRARHILLATDQSSAAHLSSQLPGRGWHSTTCWYLACPSNPFPARHLILNGSGRGVISNIAVPSSVCPAYAPPDNHLLTVSLRPNQSPSEEHLFREVRQWAGQLDLPLRTIATFAVPHALPRQLPGDNPFGRASPRLDDGLWVCGDYRYSSSLEGAIVSAELAVKGILAAP